MSHHYHLTVGGRPWCDYSACQAYAALAHVHTCGHVSIESAVRAAEAIAKNLRPGTVAVVFGPCPEGPD